MEPTPIRPKMTRADHERLRLQVMELEYYLRHCLRFERPLPLAELRGSVTDDGGSFIGGAADLAARRMPTGEIPNAGFTRAVAAFYDAQLAQHQRATVDLRRRLDPRWAGWREALALEPVGDRLAVEVWIVEDRTRAEAAEILGIHETTLTERKGRALRSMVLRLTAAPAPAAA